ncbi:sigma-54-dependent transcriptional regulator [Brevibacillus sp. H7]|uniref:sigma-54-dependent transcriptional regulator n=1 Tax=Brevibacillus sp. H7 TaxID=3349138 RepID=UPI00381CBD7B
MTQRILLVDDEANVRKALTTALRKEGYETQEAASGAQALEMMPSFLPDVMLIDLRMPELDGMETLRRLKQSDGPQPNVVMMTAYGSADDVMEAMKWGAFDYVQKPFDLAQVKQVVAKALANRQTAEREEPLEEKPERPNNLVGLSSKMQEVYKLVGKVSMTKATVLIQGESGTGKELIARAIHANSARGDKPLISVNCGAIPENLLESELFGYERGAFTGAAGRKPGMFELADGGTLFLDEIGELSLPLQVKLLRALQERSITRLGGLEAVPVDVRIIAATNQNLVERMKRGLFREDLYYRLNVVPIWVPPLRQRKEDIPLLVQHFLAKFRGQMGKPIRTINQEAMEMLIAFDWPGNVRQLENVIERAMVMVNGAAILPEHLQTHLPAGGKVEAQVAAGIRFEGRTMREILQEVEREVIRRTLRKTGGNKVQTARLLGMSRRALLYKIEAYGLDREEDE